MMVSMIKKIAKRGSVQSEALETMGPRRLGSSTPLRGMATMGLSLIIFTGAVTFPGCGRPEEADNSSEVQGVAGKQALSEAATVAMKNFDSTIKAAVKNAAGGAAQVTQEQMRGAVKGIVFKTAAAGVPRYNLQLLLEDFIEGDPSKFGLKKDGLTSQVVTKKADEIFSEVEKGLTEKMKSKELSGENKKKVETALAKLKERGDEDLIPCKKD